MNIPPPRYLVHLDVLYYRCPSCRAEFTRIAPKAICGTCHDVRVPIDLTRTLAFEKDDPRKEDPMSEQMVQKLIEAAVQTGFLQAVFKILADDPAILARLAKVVSDALKKS